MRRTRGDPGVLSFLGFDAPMRLPSVAVTPSCSPRTPPSSKHPYDLAAVQQLDAPELAAAFAPLEERNRDQPRADDALGRPAADRHAVVGEHRALLLDPATEVPAPGMDDHVGLAVPPVVEWAAVGEALGQ